MVGDKLYALRIKNKMSQEELAEKIGVSRQALQKWEINAGLPTVDNLIKNFRNDSGLFVQGVFCFAR